MSSYGSFKQHVKEKCACVGVYFCLHRLEPGGYQIPTPKEPSWELFCLFGQNSGVRGRLMRTGVETLPVPSVTLSSC